MAEGRPPRSARVAPDLWSAAIATSYSPTSTTTFSPSRACAATDSHSAAYSAGTAAAAGWCGSPGRNPIPGCKAGGVFARATSTPMLTHTPGNVFWIAAAMDDFPERGAPLRITIWPGDELTLTTTNLTRKR